MTLSFQWTVSGILGDLGGHAVQHVGLPLAKGQGQRHSKHRTEVLHAQVQQLGWQSAVKMHVKLQQQVMENEDNFNFKLYVLQWTVTNFIFVEDSTTTTVTTTTTTTLTTTTTMATTAGKKLSRN